MRSGTRQRPGLLRRKLSKSDKRTTCAFTLDTAPSRVVGCTHDSVIANSGAALMRRGSRQLYGSKASPPPPGLHSLYTRFAELQAELGEVDAALATLDQMLLAEVERSGHRSS